MPQHRSAGQASSLPPGEYAEPYPTDDGDIDVFTLLRQLIEGKWLIIAVTLVCTALAVSKAITATPVYRAYVLLAPAESQSAGGGRLSSISGQLGQLASFAGVSLGNGDGNGIETAIAFLKSRKFIGTFIRDHNLKPVLYRGLWNEQTKTWNAPSGLSHVIKEFKANILPPPPKYANNHLAENEPSDLDAFAIFSKLIAVEKDTKTSLVTVSVTWTDPELAAYWANDLIQRVNAEIRHKAVVEAQRSISYLQGQLAKATLDELRTALADLIEEQMKGITFAEATDEFVFNVIDPAVPPELIAKPNRKLLVILGLFGGLMLGVVAVFIRSGWRSYKQRIAAEHRNAKAATELEQTPEH